MVGLSRQFFAITDNPEQGLALIKACGKALVLYVKNEHRISDSFYLPIHDLQTFK
jgi:hypothetical protein